MSLVSGQTYFLGLQVKQKKKKDGIFISQSKYARKILKKFGLENANHVRTPMGTTVKLTKDENGPDIYSTLYRSMIGSLLYLIANQPDICYNVGVCARYQANPKESHLASYSKKNHSLYE